MARIGTSISVEAVPLHSAIRTGEPMAARVKSKPLQKRSPAAAAFDRCTLGVLLIVLMILQVVVVSQGPEATMHQLATGLSAWVNGSP